MNIGAGIDYSVREYYEKVCKVLKLDLNFTFDLSKPTGMKQKLMCSSVARNNGWNPSTNLDDGLLKTITWKNLVALNG